MRKDTTRIATMLSLWEHPVSPLIGVESRSTITYSWGFSGENGRTSGLLCASFAVTTEADL